MKILVNLPLQSRHVRLFSPEALVDLAKAAPGRPCFLNPAGTEPGERLGEVESAKVVGDRVTAVLDVELPEPLQRAFDDGHLAFGINANVERTRKGDVITVDRLLRLNSVDLVRPPR